ncbi:TolC family protein [Lacinutrix jangbogonensis]|uniref:TolC family protein n=1 Tax=Lacinutrix jangbogonensis TaxID=1469557 RepID=UPI00053EE49F|nr:TolC family protein [Lacinutrix jangbogonensis]
MKKNITILLLMVTLLAFSQTKKNYNIGVLLDYQTPRSELLLFALQNEIKAVVGEDAIISFSEDNLLVNSFNLEKAKANYNALLNSNTDIILAFGLINNAVISNLKTHQKPTILFGAINEDFNYFEAEKSTSRISNFTYLITHQSFKRDLKALKELTNFTKVGIAIEEGLIAFLPFKTIFDAETEALGVSYKIIPYNNCEDITNNITSDIDAFYLASGFFLNENEIAKISAKLIKEKTPSFTNTSVDHVKKGLMATNNSEDNIELFFRRIALNIESYVNGQNLSESPVFINYDDKLTVNYNTAKSVGMPIKYSLIGNTNFVGDFVNILSEKKYNLLDVMKTVIGENLSLQSSKKEIALSEQDVKTSKSNYYPSVIASASGTYVDPNLAEVSFGNAPEFSTKGVISLEQTLFSESTNANITIQKELLKAQQEVYNTDKLDAVFEVSNVYFNALILKANLKIQSKNLNLTKKNLQIAKQNYEAGQSGKSDVLRFTSEAAQNKQTLVEAINQLEQTFFILNQLLNNPIDYEIDVNEAELGEGILKKYNYQQIRDLIDDPKLRKTFVEYLQKIAKENAPEIKSLNYNLIANKRSIKLNGSGRFLPTLALQAQYNNEFNRSGKGTAFNSPNFPSNDYYAGISLSLPIFNRTQTTINKQIATIQQDQLSINKDSAERAIEVNVNTAVLDLINQIANIEISEISEKAAKESLELTQVSYSNGAVNIVQLLDAQNNYLSSQQAQITAVYSYLLSSIQLERYISYYFLLHSTEENAAFIEGFNQYLENRN